jgi:hypothetical protein
VKKTSNRRLKGVAIFVVFLALAISIFEFQSKSTSKSSMDFKPSANEYRDLRFINKARVSFSSSDISAAQDEISRIMNQYAKQRIRKQNEGNYGAYLFTIEQQELNSVIAELEKFGSIGPQTEQIDTALVNLDFEIENARLAAYENELVELNKIRQPTIQQNDRKEALHTLIQTSRNNLEKLSNIDNVLLYLTLRPQQRSIGWLSIIIGFAKSFLMWLLILTIGTILVYYGTRLLMYFLSLLGVRGPGGAIGGSYNYGGYGGYSGYSRYSSRYGGSKRKVKRIYKDKDSSSTQKDDEDQDHK